MQNRLALVIGLTEKPRRLSRFEDFVVEIYILERKIQRRRSSFSESNLREILKLGVHSVSSYLDRRDDTSVERLRVSSDVVIDVATPTR